MGGASILQSSVITSEILNPQLHGSGRKWEIYVFPMPDLAPRLLLEVQGFRGFFSVPRHLLHLDTVLASMEIIQMFPGAWLFSINQESSPLKTIQVFLSTVEPRLIKQRESKRKKKKSSYFLL